jgi:hypothetical protein
MRPEYVSCALYSCIGYTATIGNMIVNEMERMWKWLQHNLRYCPTIFLEILKNDIANISG